MKFSFVPQTFFRIFFFGSGSGSWGGSGFHYKIHWRKFLWKSKFCSESGSGSWYYFGFQYQTYISYIQDTHPILFGSANSFKSYCVHMKSPRTYVHPDIQTDRQTEIFFGSFCLLRLTNHEYLSKERIFFFTHAITILALLTYSVCDEKVKKLNIKTVLNSTVVVSLWHIFGQWWIHSPANVGVIKRNVFIPSNNNTIKKDIHYWKLKYLEFCTFDSSGSSYLIHYLKFLNIQFIFVISA